jgi:hypothetical protein
MAPSRGLLDPGSRPVSRGLAGMTICDTASERRGIRCHAGPDKPAPAISKPGVSSLDFWIPAIRRAQGPEPVENPEHVENPEFIEGSRWSKDFRRNDDSSQAGGV